MLGYRFFLMQAPRQIAACLPQPVARYLRECYPPSHVNSVLPDGEDIRVELFGQEDMTLGFTPDSMLLWKAEKQKPQPTEAQRTGRTGGRKN